MKAKRCTLCGNVLTPKHDSAEHIIPNAIGGRKRVVGFICRACNNDAGSKWDSELAHQLNLLGLLLGISSQCGKIPPQEFSTLNGLSLRLHPNGIRTFAKPIIQATKHGTTKRLNIRVATRRELRRLLKGMRRKYPSLRKSSLDDLMSTAKADSHYSSDWTAFKLYFGGKQAGRSLVKSAVALTHDGGIDPNTCDLALDYLLNVDAEPCFGYYYNKNRDIVINRPVGKPFHCVYVKGDSENATITGYVELYSLHRVVLCLSNSYSGKDFTNIYAIDPVKGEELDLKINLDLPISDIRSAFEYEFFDEEVRLSAARSLFDCIGVANFKRELKRIIKESVKKAFAKCSAEQGEYLTYTQLRHLMEDVFQDLTPFIEHNVARSAFPIDPRPELYK